MVTGVSLTLFEDNNSWRLPTERHLGRMYKASRSVGSFVRRDYCKCKVYSRFSCRVLVGIPENLQKRELELPIAQLALAREVRSDFGRWAK